MKMKHVYSMTKNPVSLSVTIHDKISRIRPDQILKTEILNKYSVLGSQNEDIGLILTMTTGVLGIGLLLHGFVRDYVSFGLCRLEMYLLLALSYLVMAISEPGKTDNLQEIIFNINIK